MMTSLYLIRGLGPTHLKILATAMNWQAKNIHDTYLN